MLELLEVLGNIFIHMHLWLILTAIVASMCINQGAVEVGVGFLGLFFFILMMGWDKWIGEYVMIHCSIAIIFGLGIGFFIWIFKN